MKQIFSKIAVVCITTAVAQVLSAEKSVALSDFNCSPAEVTADLSGKADFTLSFTVTNTGDEDISVGDEGYKFQAGEFNFLGSLTMELGTGEGDVPLAVGETATVTMPCSVILPDVAVDKTVTVKVKEFFNNTVVPEMAYQCKKVSVLSPVARISVKSGLQTISEFSTMDYGMLRVSEADVSVTVSNTGRSPLTIDELIFGDGLDGVAAKTVFPLTVDAGGATDVVIALGTDPKGMKGDVRIKYNDAVDDKEFVYVVRAALTCEDDVVEDFADGIPSGWYVAPAPGVESANFWSTRTVNGNALLTQGDTDKKSRLITPLIGVDPSRVLTFMAGHTNVPVNDSSTLVVYWSSDRETWTELGRIVKSVGSQRKPFNTFEWTDEKNNQMEWYNLALSRLEAGDYYFAFEAGMCMLDNVYTLPAATIGQDMIIDSFGVPAEGMVNYPMTFTADVLNMLGVPVEEGSYTLRLFENDVEVAESAAAVIEAYAAAELKIGYVSHSEGENVYRAVLSYGDRTLTAEKWCTVVPESSEMPVQIGAVEGVSNSIPLNMDAFASKMQTIITADEIGLAPGCEITEITLLGTNTSYETTKQFAVALDTAEKSGFTAGDSFITPETFVFAEKDVVFPKAGSEADPAKFVLKLDTPYLYEGGDLLMTVTRANGFASGLKFAYHNVAETEGDAPLRTLSVSKSYAVSEEKTDLLSEAPTVIFTVPVEPMKLTGSVVDGDVSVADAPVTIKAGDVHYSSITDADGKFEMPVIQKGTYSLFVEYNGSEYNYPRPVVMDGNDPVNVSVDLQMTGISPVAAPVVKVRISGNNVIVSGVAGTVSAYTADGCAVAKAVADGEAEVTLPTGIYILDVTGRDGSRAIVKVNVK